jgi:hypothetical protein
VRDWHPLRWLGARLIAILRWLGARPKAIRQWLAKLDNIRRLLAVCLVVTCLVLTLLSSLTSSLRTCVDQIAMVGTVPAVRTCDPLSITSAPIMVLLIAAVVLLVPDLMKYVGKINIAGLIGIEAAVSTHKPSGVALVSAEPQQSLEPPLAPAQFESARVPALEAFGPVEREILNVSTLPDWTRERERLYEANRDLFLVHQIRPSKQPGQKYDVFVFLAGARGIKPSTVVEQADFFLGPYWGNRIFPVHVQQSEETIGITTSAYGPALCICRVKLRDGAEIILHRFLDFEMSWLFEVVTRELAR